MLKKIFLCLVTLGFLGFSIAHARPLNVTQILEATCRVSVVGGMGSGTCYDYKDGKYYILTNAHVVDRNTVGKVEFFKFGKKTKPLPANVIWKLQKERTPVDFAILTVDASYFGDYPPRVIPFVDANYSYKIGDYITSAGCAKGAWAKGWEGTIVKSETGRVIFHPPPVGGQSGSGLLTTVKVGDEYETRILGVVTWRIGPITVRRDETGYEQAKGGAVLIDTLRQAQQGKVIEFTRVPDYYVEVGTRMALGSDGKAYAIGIHADGSYEAVIPPNVRIVDWNHTIDLPPQRWKGGDYFIPYSTTPPPLPTPPNRKPILPIIPRKPNEPTPTPPLPVPPNTTPKENPYGSFPEWAEKYDEDKLKKELDTCRGLVEALKNERDDQAKTIINQESSIKKLQEQQDILIAKSESQLKELNDTLTQLKKDIAGLQGDKTSLEQEKVTLQGTIKTQKQELDGTLEQLKALNTKIGSMSAEITSKDVELTEAITKGEDKVEPNTFALTSILAFVVPVLSWLGWTWWKKNGGRQKIKDKMDAIENVVQAPIAAALGPEITQQMRDSLDSFETRIGDKLEKYLGAKQTGNFDSVVKDLKTDILDKVDNILKSVPVVEEVAPQTPEPSPAKTENAVTTLQNEFKRLQAELTDNFEKRLAEKVPSSITNIIQTAATKEKEVPDEPDLTTLPTTPQGMEYIKQLFALKEKEGESVKHWAVFAQLYKEAVGQLRLGKLYLDGTTKLQGQARTADAIDNWVRKEFLKKLTIEDIRDKDSLYKDALIGVLYKDAVDNLRCGKLDILGAETTAAAIQEWVEKEFLRRMGIKLT